MDLVLRRSGGQNIVLRPQARATWYPDATVDAATVEIFKQDIDPDTGALIGTPVSLGIFPATGEVLIDYNPDTDRDARIYVVARGPDGTPNVSSLADATQATLVFQRDTEAPIVSQVGASTAELITIAVDGTTRLARRRKVRVADNSDMTDASTTIRSFGINEVPRLVDIARSAQLVSDFSWSGNDPASNGFTKVGSGTTAASTSPAGWRITTSGSDAATYYTKNSFPASPFAAGFTLELMPPAVVASDGGALPNNSVLVYVDDGTKRYEIRFDADEVFLNGGSAHAHADAKVRLVIAVGGNVADLWVGDTKVENDTAGLSSVAAGLGFGDTATTDDSEVVWRSLAYALTPQDVRLAETIYVRVSHSSGGAFGAESDVAEFTFASEGGAGGSVGDGELVPRDRYDYEL